MPPKAPVNAEKMPDTFVLLSRRTDTSAFPVTAQGIPVSRRQAKQECLIFAGQIPVIEQRHDHLSQAA